MPSEFLTSIFLATFYFCLTSVTLSFRVKSLYKTILENERLVAENKSLLKIFPHGVVIEQKSPTQQTANGFSNREFETQIKKIQKQLRELEDIKVIGHTDKAITSDTGSSQSLYYSNMSQSTDLYSYLKKQQESVTDEGIHEDTNVSILLKNIDNQNERLLIGNNEQSDLSSEYCKKVFNIKTLEVTWEGNPSFMHVFIDTTNIRRLEEANNNIKLQRIMFTSISHEFRTPLNAIINSYQFIKDKFEEFFGRDSPRVKESDSIRKFINMGHNSSYLLLSLIEDILDLSKMEAGTFKMNFSEFNLSELLTEVYEIFQFQ